MNSARRIYDLYFFDDGHGYASAQIMPLRTNGIVMDVPEPQAEGIGLFPNPALDEVVVRWDGGGSAQVEVMDATGRAVRAMRVSGSMTTIDLQGLLPGSYLVRVTANGSFHSARLLRM